MRNVRTIAFAAFVCCVGLAVGILLSPYPRNPTVGDNSDMLFYGLFGALVAGCCSLVVAIKPEALDDPIACPILIGAGSMFGALPIVANLLFWL